MYSSLRKAGSARAYASIGLETEVLSASPVRLVTLLLDGALAAIAKAKLYLQNDNVAGRGMAISKAIDIIDSGLKASLDMETGGEVAKNLSATYELVVYHLLQANLEASAEKLDLAHQLLQPIAEAWHNLAETRELASV